jgi:hypothetical protein
MVRECIPFFAAGENPELKRAVDFLRCAALGRVGWLAAEIFEEPICRLTKGGRTSGAKALIFDGLNGPTKVRP